jgi:hypothetical protein
MPTTESDSAATLATALAPAAVYDNPNDGQGNSTITAGSTLLVCIKPIASRHAQLDAFSYTPGATTHNGYAMPAHDAVTVTDDAIVGATSIKVDRRPADMDGNAAASGDVITVEYSDGTFACLAITGVGTLSLSVAALTKVIKSGTTLYFHSAPADHTTRKYVLTTGSTTTISPPRGGIAQCPTPGYPMAFAVDNLTNAGTLNWVTWSHQLTSTV